MAALACTSCALSTERPEERATTWARAYLDARCRYHVRCEPAFGPFAGREQAVCHPDGWLAELEERATRVGDTFAFDEARAARCLAAIEDAPCSVEPGTPYDADILGCEDVLVGTVPEGGACDPTLGGRCVDAPCPGECADHGSCVAEGMSCGGVCRAPARRDELCDTRPCEVGTECVFLVEAPRCRAVDLEPAAECVPEDRCRTIDGRIHGCIEGRCAPVPVVAVGAACGVRVGTCEDGAICQFGLCVAQSGEDGPCRAHDECLDGLLCDEDAAGRRCIPLPPDRCRDHSDCPAAMPLCLGTLCAVAVIGEPCSVGLTGPSEFRIEDPCPDGDRCHLTRISTTGRCVPIVDEGAECDINRACPDGTRCSGGRCVRIVVEPGAACGTDAVCPLTHRCIGGACAPLPGLGETCDGECFGGACIDGRCALLPQGAACDDVLDPWVPQCTDLCQVRACRGHRGVAGEPCNLFTPCAHELDCVAQPDGSGVCTAECSE